MKKLLSLGLLCSALSLIGMDQKPRAFTVDEASRLLYEDICPSILKTNGLKTVGGLAAVYVLHKSGKPFPPHAFVTTLGTRVEVGNAFDFHRLMSEVETTYRVATVDNDLLNSFANAFVRVRYIKKSCYTRGKELAAEIPAGQTMRWICEPIRVIEGHQMPEIDEPQRTKIIQWIQTLPCFSDELKEENLVSLDECADWDGTLVYPQGWTSIEEKMERFEQAQRSAQGPKDLEKSLEELDL